MAKIKTSGVFLALCLGSILAIHQTSCLTPAQQQNMAVYSQTLDQAKAEVLALQAELAKYRGEMAAIKADVQAGKVPVESGLALADKVLANIDSTQQRLAGAMSTVDKTGKAIADLKASGAPWWAYAIPAGLTVAQLLGTFVPQLSFLVPIAGALKGQLAGAQTQLAATQSRLATTAEITGSLSRTLDGVVEGDPVLAAKKQELMRKEQSEDLLAVKADYDEIRSLSACKQI